MSKNRYSKRLEALFSESSVTSPEPTPAAAALDRASTEGLSSNGAAGNGQYPAAQDTAESEMLRARIAELEAQLASTQASDPGRAEDLKALLEFSPEAIGVVNTQTGRFDNVNAAAERLYGLKREELVKVGPAEMSPEFQPNGRPSLEMATERIGEALQGGRPVFEWTHRNAAGDLIPCEVRLVGLASPRQHLVRFSVVDISDRKRAEAETQRSQELLKFKLGIERSTEAVFITDVDGTIVYANPAFERVYGYSPAESIGRTPRILKSGVIPPERYQHFWQTLLAKGTVAGEIINKTKDGRLVNIEGSNNPILDEAGNLIGFLATHRDVTERKQTELRLNLQATAIDSAAEAVVITDPAGTIEWVNPAFTRLTGYAAEEAIGSNPRVLRSGQHDPAFYADMWNTINSGKVWRGEIVNRHKDGRLYYEDQTITPVMDAQGQATHFVATKRDITERRKAEEALRASQAQLAEALTIAQLANWEYDVEKDLFLFNDQFYAIFHTTAEREGGYQMSSARYAERFVHPEDLPLVGLEIERALTSTDRHYSRQLDHRIVYADGGTGYISVRLYIDRDEQGHILRYYGANQDITGHKRAEAALKETEERLRLIVETVPIPLLISATSDGTVLFANAMLGETFGLPISDLVGRQTPDFYVNPADRNVLLEKLRKEGALRDYELAVKRVDGTPMWMLVSMRPVMFAGQSALLAAFYNVTERKQAEEAIKAEQQRTQTILETITVPMIISRLSDSKVLYANQALSEFRHVPLEELIGGRTADYFVNPDDRARLVELLKRQGYAVDFETQLQRRDGIASWVLLSARVINYQNETCVLTTYVDITARKQAEEALQRLSSQYQLVFGTVGDGIFSLDADGKHAFVNPAAARMLGYEVEELIGRHSHSTWHYSRPDGSHYPSIECPIYATLRDAVMHSGEEYFWRKDGTGFSVDFTSTPILEGDKTVGAVVTFRDITGRKQAEDALRQSEAQLAEALKVAQLANWEYDVEKDLFLFNDQFYAIFHTTAEREGGYQMSSARYAERFVHPEDLPLVGLEIERALTSTDRHYSRQLDHRIVYADGGTGYISVRLYIDRDEQGHILRYYGANQDITDRKRAEAEVRRRNLELAAFNRIVATAAESLDLRHILSVAAQELVKLLDVRNSGIGILEPGGQSLTIVADANQDPAEPSAEGLVIPVAGNPSTQYVLEHKRSVVIADAQTDPLTASIHDLMRERRTRGLMIVPLLRRGDVVGTIGADTTDPNRQFTPAEVALVESVAAQLTGAIDNIRLFEGVQRRASDLSTVAQVGTTVSTLRDTQEMLQAVVDLAKSSFGLYHAHLYLLNAEGDTLVLTVGAGEVGRQLVVNGHRIPLNRQQSLVARAARDRVGVIVNDVSLDPYFLPNPLLPDTRSELAVPLIAGDTLLGVLDVQSDVAGRFTDEDASIQTTLAAQVAVALQNARSFERSERALAELNALTRRLTRESWQGYLRQRDHVDQAYIYDLSQVEPVQALSDLARLSDEGVVKPLSVQGEPVGRLAVAEPGVPEDDADAIVAAVADRLSAHLENLRLTEQTMQSLTRQEHLSTQLETVVQVSTVASTILESRQLLQEVVDLTKERFGLYHAHIYLYDDVSETLQLAAGSGEVGRRMAAEERIIPMLLEQSIVSRAARTRKPVVVDDVLQSELFQPNPLLPETRSELALPMIVGERLLGVFDVQSHQPGRFTDEDARIQGTLAAQVSVALQNANLYAEQAATVARLQELDHLKSSFLANMSHELRTPLNSILGFTDVILEGLDGPLTERMDNDLKVVQKNGQHLLGLINDILDMAKIEAGRMTISPERISLSEVVDEVMEITGSLVREKKLYLTTDITAADELELEADRVRLRQVLINLVGNSVKFTETGGITITASRADEHILICVRDTGIGIPSHKTDAIFEAFSQVDTSTTRKAGGTGLGLPISRHLIELHGGRLWAESHGVPGEGSRFFIELPVEFKHNVLQEQTP